MLQLHDKIPPVLLHNNHLTAKKIRHPSVLGFEVGQDLQVSQTLKVTGEGGG